MKLMSLLSGTGFVMYNKELAHEVSVNGAIIFGQLCSSYLSFESKGMLTIRDDKEYFFLTSEILEEETSLTYKQQLKAARELEEAGYIETRVMGVPSKKYFHITDKIETEYKGNPSSDKREDLNISTDLEDLEDTPRNAKRENLACPKGNTKECQKGSTIKKKNKKEQYKDKKDNIDNYQDKIINVITPTEFKAKLAQATNELYPKFAINRWSKKQWNVLVEKFVEETVESGRYRNIPPDNMKGYAFKAFQNIADHSDYKYSDEMAEYEEAMRDIATRNL